MSKRASLKFFKMATAETLTAPARLSRDPRADGHALSTTRGCRAAGLQTPCFKKKVDQRGRLHCMFIYLFAVKYF